MISEKIKNALKKIGINELNDIQIESVKKIKDNKNLLISAPTGSGKTLAALIPIFENLREGEGIKVLYITPLRSLNRDIFWRVIRLGEELGLRVELRHGDTPQNKRRKQVKEKIDVLITTPETFQIMLVAKNLRKKLKDVQFVVIDEIHELFESKRGVQLALGLERLEEITKFRRIGLSATIKNWEEVGNFFLKDFDVIFSKSKRKYFIDVVYGEGKKYIKLGIPKKLSFVLETIEKYAKNNKILIFTNTREIAEALGSKLKEIGLNIEVHHSSLSRKIREENEKNFREGKIKGLIATSSLELGIDIGDVDLVIQFESPRRVTKLIQRVGRSRHGRGDAYGVIIVIDKDNLAESLAIKDLLERGWMEDLTCFEKCYDVLMHQIAGISLEYKDLDVYFLYRIIRRCYPYRNLSMDELKEVLDFMSKIGIIYFDGEKIKRRRRIIKYYFENLSMIPDEKSYLVIEGKNKIGILHEGFVQNLDYGSRFIMKGDTWEVVDFGKKAIFVKKVNEFGGTPSWIGELIPVEKEVSFLSAEYRKNLYKDPFYPNKSEIWIEGDKIIVIHSVFGSKINLGLANLIASYLANKYGIFVETSSDQYRIIIKTNFDLKEDVYSFLKNISNEYINEMISYIRNSGIYLQRFLHVAKRMGILEKEADTSKKILKKIKDYYIGTVLDKEVLNEIFKDKIDLKGLKDLIKAINENKIKIKIWNGKLSNMAKESILLSSYFEFFPKEIDLEILEAVKERLENKRFRFVCMYCKRDLGLFSVKNAPQICKYCGSKYIAFGKNEEIKELKRILRKKELNKKEKEILEKFRDIASLYLSHRKYALYCYAGYGIGLTNMKRILKKYRDEKDLLKLILEEEKRFIRTRRFWEE